MKMFICRIAVAVESNQAIQLFECQSTSQLTITINLLTSTISIRFSKTTSRHVHAVDLAVARRNRPAPPRHAALALRRRELLLHALHLLAPGAVERRLRVPARDHGVLRGLGLTPSRPICTVRLATWALPGRRACVCTVDGPSGTITISPDYALGLALAHHAQHSERTGMGRCR